MAKQFDATLNSLLELNPQDWCDCFARLCGVPTGPATALDTDLATTVQADRLFRVGCVPPTLLHLEFASNPRSGIPRELMRYNDLADLQYGLPVETALVLLRPKALTSDQTGVHVRRGVRGNPIHEFRYTVVRVWEQPVDFWLRCGPALAPLALLTDEAAENFGPAFDRLETDLKGQNLPPGYVKDLLTATYVLSGLRYVQADILPFFVRWNMDMEDSTTYQWILQKGVQQGIPQGYQQAERAILLRQGRKRFGPPSEQSLATLEAIQDPERLAALCERLLDVGSWDELFAAS